MALLTWDAAGERYYETGVSKVVLYQLKSDGSYDIGVAWNGVTGITESPSGAEPTPQYADNIKYLNLISAEEFALTLEAFTYPTEFEECDGALSPTPGTILSQQTRKSFGLCYRTELGNDADGNDLGYKLHLVYGLTASPSEKAFSTINDSPEAITFSWECSSVPALATGYGPTSLIVVDSVTADPTQLALLEDQLYGTDTPTDPTLDLPDDVITMITP